MRACVTDQALNHLNVSSGNLTSLNPTYHVKIETFISTYVRLHRNIKVSWTLIQVLGFN